MAFYEGLGSRWFQFIHRNNLIYNTCWEDPRVDRQALEIDRDDVMMVISSAGCNTLDYLLQEPRRIYCVDMNPRQNALLELKMAAIRAFDYETFFQMFGRGRLPNHNYEYDRNLRPLLSGFARSYWDRKIGYFAGRGWRSSFYFNGTAGTLARFVNSYIDRGAGIRDAVNRFLEARTLEEQRHLYFGHLKHAFWKRFVRWLVGRDETLSLLGVPKPQRQQVDSTYAGGIAKFIEDRIDRVFAGLPFGDNYFWRVYLTGEYTRECCPEYLKEENFERLKGGLLDRVETYTGSTVDFLKQARTPISKFVLLDHMDWLSYLCRPLLEEEWQLILDKAAPGGRIIWRSGSLDVDFIDPIRVRLGPEKLQLGDILNYHWDKASALHKKDRVCTYGSFYIADLAT